MLRMLAILFGIALLYLLGQLRLFFPHFMQNGLLLGIFEVDKMHNLIHIASGVLAILAAVKIKYTKWYFRLFGIIYGMRWLFWDSFGRVILVL